MNAFSSVLIVDDSEIDHITAKYTIEDYDRGVEVYSVYDGAEALKVLNAGECKPDIIFLDINMPGMDGHTFLSEYAKAPSSSAVIVMLTSSNQTEDREKTEKYEFVQAYITKPLDEQHLSSLEKLLKK